MNLEAINSGSVSRKTADDKVCSMETTRVSEQGQIIISQAMRKAYGWEPDSEYHGGD